MATRRPLVVVNGRIKELPTADSLPGGGGGSSLDLVRTPTNINPAQGAVNVGVSPILIGSPYGSVYGVAQNAAEFQISTTSDFAVIAYTSGVVGSTVSHQVAGFMLTVSSVYFWRARHRDSDNVWSAWSTPTSFTTAAVADSFITTPAATPAAFGDAFEGGFYIGMIWNELVQSATSTTIGTGSKAFTVPDMAGAPIVYAGQTLEVRSRANPGNRMFGTVASAAGTALTLNVTGVSGTGTFADWSIMARYRIIVAPKATGENPSLAWKNAATIGPSASLTLTEGRKSTLAMVSAGTSTVYPAAHWCNNLNIASRTDWYLPSRDEFELVWRNLKPSTDANSTGAERGASTVSNLGSFADLVPNHGSNRNSAPAGAAYTTTDPAQVAAGKNFRTGETESFLVNARYWTSSDRDAGNACLTYFWTSFPGYQSAESKTNIFTVRAVRRSII